MLLRKSGWVEVFGNLETIIIDEAHYFALTERGSHLVSLLERLDAGIGRTTQRIAVTATVGNPDEMLKWLLGKKSEGVAIKANADHEKKRDFLVKYFKDEGALLRSFMYRELLQNKSIVFERSRSATEESATWINQQNALVSPPFPVNVRTHHSSVSKRLREGAESSIKQNNEGSVNCIISTSTLELGIDIGELDKVIQVGSLTSSGSFLQRVGRTGRRAGKPQYFRGLCADADELLLLIACVSLGLRRVSEKVLFPTRAFHILAHQIICICLQKAGATASEIWAILSNAGCFANVTEREFEQLVDFMVHEDFLRVGADGLLLTSNKTETQFLRANWKRLFAIFDTGPMYNVVDGKKIIGTLDSEFARAQKLPFVFVLGGTEWSAKKIDHELQQISVLRNETGIAPKWKAFAQFDIPFELAQEIGRLLMSDEELNFLDPEAERDFHAQRERYKSLQWTAGRWILDTSVEFGKIYLWTFAGEKVNRALALLLGSGLPEMPDYDYQNIVIEGTKDHPVHRSEVEELLAYLKTLSLEEIDDKIVDKVEAKWFSKFADCLPESLSRSTIKDKGYDTAGLSSLLAAIQIFS